MSVYIRSNNECLYFFFQLQCDSTNTVDSHMKRSFSTLPMDPGPRPVSPHSPEIAHRVITGGERVWSMLFPLLCPLSNNVVVQISLLHAVL